MNCFKIRVLLLFTVLLAKLLFGQETTDFQVPDSLQNKDYETLKSNFFTYVDDKNKAAIYAQTILTMGKIEKDTSRILRGFSFLAYLNRENDSILIYSDSILKFAEKADKLKYLGLGNLNKAEYYFTLRNFKGSLDHYLIAKNYYEDDARVNFIIDHAIGVLKSRVGDTLAAAEIFKKSWEFVKENNYKETDNYNYLITLFSLAASYTDLGQLDSASYFNHLGMKEARLAENETEFYHFKLNQAVNYFHKKEYNVAIDSITTSLTHLKNDRPNLIVGYFYLGKAYYEKNREEEAVKSFIKVDSLFQETGDMLPEARASYEYIITYYESKNDKANQLKYIKALMRVDSILDENYKYLSKNISLRYDTPRLLEEKEMLINALEKEKKSFSRNFIIALLLFALSLTGLIMYYYRQKRYKKRFEALLNKTTIPEKVTPATKPLEISDDVTTDLLEKLKEFEDEERFLSGDLSISVLAKTFSTNTKYLSVVINYYKGKSFTRYINALRMDYTIEKLKTDRLFRKYSVKAIAEEVGFNSVEIFSKLFYKKTGIRPSYFIKNLEKERES